MLNRLCVFKKYLGGIMKKIVILLLCTLSVYACELSVSTKNKQWCIEKIAPDYVLLWCIAVGRESGRKISTGGKDINGIVLSSDERYVALRTSSGDLFWDTSINEFVRTSVEPRLEEFKKRVSKGRKYPVHETIKKLRQAWESK
jgi:hypothetical protein